MLSYYNVIDEVRSFVREHKDYFSFISAINDSMQNDSKPRSEITVMEDGMQSCSTSAVLNEAELGSNMSKRGALSDFKDGVVNNCTKCRLSEKRKNIVFGEGSPDAKLMFIGEAPGADEDETGKPFVGRAGQLLTKIIESINLKREDVYIANVIKCRPPENRNPAEDEIESCSGFLREQIEIIKPKIICTLGKFPMEFIIGNDKGTISKVRGNVFDYNGIIVIPTYHPSYLLRNPSAKRETWEDMKKIRDLYFK